VTTTPSCIYDNPATWQRELWVDGRLDCFVTAELLLQKKWPWRSEPPAAWLKQWEPGSMQGDPEAILQPENKQ